jgi:FtsZ-binding cell division protein ZapB
VTDESHSVEGQDPGVSAGEPGEPEPGRRLDELEADRAQLEADRVRLSGEVAGLRADVDELEADNRRLASEADELRTDRDRLDREIQRLHGELDATRAALPEIEELQSRLRELTEDYERSVSALQGLLPYAVRVAAERSGPAPGPAGSPPEAEDAVPGDPEPAGPAAPPEPPAGEPDDDAARIEVRGGWDEGAWDE